MWRQVSLRLEADSQVSSQQPFKSLVELSIVNLHDGWCESTRLGVIQADTTAEER